MTILQIVTFTASSKYLAQPKNVMKEALDALESGEGCAGVFHGLQIEDGKTVYIFSLWESEEQYESFAGGAGHFSILAGIKTAAASYPKVHYLSTGPSAVELIPAFSAPITDFGLWTLKPDVSPKDAQLVQGFEELKAGLDVTAGAHPPALWATCQSSARNVVLVVGWDTVDAHLQAVKEGTELNATGQLLLKKANLVMGHVKLVKHKTDSEVD